MILNAPDRRGAVPFTSSVDRGTAESIMSYLQKSDAVMRVAQLRVLRQPDGTVYPSDATAFAHRQSRIW